MSKISLTGNASGSGSVILQAPNSSTNRTLTVSEASGNIAISDGSTLTVDYASNRTTIGGKADFYGASTVKLDKWNIIGANTTLSVGQNYFANTRAQANLQLTLPSSANIGDTIMVQDQEGFASSNNVVVLRNGHNIDGVERNAVLTVDNSGVSLVYESARNGWVSVKHAPKDLVGFQGSVSGFSAGGGVNFPPTPLVTSFDNIDKFPFATDTNATSVGSLVEDVQVGSGQSSVSHGFSTGGSGATPVNPGPKTMIQKFPFTIADGTATDVGDLNSAKFYNQSGNSSDTHGYDSGGYTPATSSESNVIEKFSFAIATGTATDIGDLSQARRQASGQSSSSHGYVSAGYAGPPGDQTRIDKFPFATDTNATNVASVTTAKRETAGYSSDISGYASGGVEPPLLPTVSNKIEKFPFATDNNATDIADLLEVKRFHTGISSRNHGYTVGGDQPGQPNQLLTIEKFPFASDANSSDVGDLTQTQGVYGSTGHQV